MLVLVLNAGSSSQKSCLYDLGNSVSDTPLEPIWSAHLDRTVSDAGDALTVKSNNIEQNYTVEVEENGLKTLLNSLIRGKTKVLNSLEEIDLVGHRVVHGGAKYSQPTIVDEEVKKAIADFIPLAPDHNPAHLEGIETIEKIVPNMLQVAVFDTAFHTTIPEFARVYPLPYKYYEQGIQRYGFHGTSHQYCASRAAQILQKPLESLKLVTCHLGNGCSLAAIQNGRCIDTTMGFSPLEGLMMGTRCGSVDPQILVHLMQQYGLESPEIGHMMNHESGLLGISGISADLRAVVAAKSDGNTRAKLAVEMYLHRLKSFIGAMVASLDGLDVLVFTAGVGENSSLIREQTCAGLKYLGLKLDSAKNNSHPVDVNIAQDDSDVEVLAIETQEDLAIARLAANHTRHMKEKK